MSSRGAPRRYDWDRIICLYEKYGSLVKVADSANISPQLVRYILICRSIPPYNHSQLSLLRTRKRVLNPSAHSCWNRCCRVGRSTHLYHCSRCTHDHIAEGYEALARVLRSDLNLVDVKPDILELLATTTETST